MRKLFVDKIESPLVVTGDDFHHLAKVLRAKIADSVTVSIGDGYDYFYKVSQIFAKEILLELVDKKENRAEPNIDITLYFAILKGDKSETVIKACTELGVKKFCPFVSEFTVSKDISFKQERLQRVALEAAKQSGRGVVPIVEKVRKISEMSNINVDTDLVLLAYEGIASQDIKTYLTTSLKKGVKKVAIIIGSEGGFSKAEIEFFEKLGVSSVSLGKRILRAETASIVVAGLVLMQAGEMC